MICVKSVDGINNLVPGVIGQRSRDDIGQLSVKLTLLPLAVKTVNSD